MCVFVLVHVRGSCKAAGVSGGRGRVTSCVKGGAAGALLTLNPHSRDADFLLTPAATSNPSPIPDIATP